MCAAGPPAAKAAADPTIFGNAPCLASDWGTNYLRRIQEFIVATGLDLLEHDGPYPGDVCASTSHPGHRGLDDSQWVQWRLSANFYGWCRAQGIYVNAPDYYFFTGTSKTGMGYREDNWSLKISGGWPEDPDDDIAGDAWAGVVPMSVRYGEPVPAPDLRPGIPVPESVRALTGGPPSAR